MMRIGCTLPAFLWHTGRRVEVVTVPPRLEGSKDLAPLVKRIIDHQAHRFAPMLSRFPLPDLYASGVRYREEAPLRGLEEEFADPWTTHERGFGDCDDLSLWRIAQGIARGEKLAATIQWRGDFLHVQVRHLVSGRIEDPSALLGMTT